MERSIREALHGAEPGSKQEFYGKEFLARLQVAKADGFRDPFGRFPEGAIRLPDITTVGMSNREMEELAGATRGLNLGDWGRDVLKRAPVASKEPQTLSPIVMDAHTMGINGDYPTTNQVWEKAKEFGDRVTAEKMLKIAIEAAKGNIQVEIGKPLVGIMEPVADSSGDPDVLCVERYRDGLWLDAYDANPNDQWASDDQFVVSSRK